MAAKKAYLCWDDIDDIDARSLNERGAFRSPNAETVELNGYHTKSATFVMALDGSSFELIYLWEDEHDDSAAVTVRKTIKAARRGVYAGALLERWGTSSLLEPGQNPRKHGRKLAVRTLARRANVVSVPFAHGRVILDRLFDHADIAVGKYHRRDVAILRMAKTGRRRAGLFLEMLQKSRARYGSRNSAAKRRRVASPQPTRLAAAQAAE